MILKAYLLTVCDSTSTNKGYIKFTSQANPQLFTFYTITNTVVDNTDYVNLTLTYVSGTTSPYNNNEDMFFDFFKNW